MRLKLPLLVASLLLFANSALALPITFSLSSSLLLAEPGQTVTFTGTISEIGGIPTYLNGDAFTSPLPLDDSPFLLNFPLVLPALRSVTAPVFRVTVPIGAAPGLYVGTFSILGGSSPTTNNVLASQSFAVQANPAQQPIPEPATATLLIVGATLAGALRARRRRRLP